MFISSDLGPIYIFLITPVPAIKNINGQVVISQGVAHPKFFAQSLEIEALAKEMDKISGDVVLFGRYLWVLPL